MRLPAILLLASSFVSPVLAAGRPATVSAGDPDAGKDVFRKCTACHTIGKGAANGMGPALTGVVGRPAASAKGYGYSDAMKKAGEKGLVWTPQSLDAFLSGPHDFIPGTKMPNIEVSEATDRADLVAYLQKFSPDFDPEAQVSSYAPPK